MAVTLTGTNALLLGQELKKITESFIAEHGDLALEKLDCEEASFERISEALTSLPFLASKKMVLLRAPSTNKQFQENAEKLFAELPDSTELIIVEPKLDKRISYYKLLKKSTDFKEFNELDINGLASWLNQQAKEGEGSLAMGDARYLVERVGQNQQLLSNELAKLLAYDKDVTKKSIDLLTDPAPQSSIFDLIEAAFSGNHKKAMSLYSEQRALKVEPQQIISMISWQLNIIAIINTAGSKSSDDIAREAKLNPFVVRKSTGIARKLNLSDVKELVRSLNKIDLSSKRTNLDLDEALQHYILKLSQY